jgi:flagellar L-ring protein FlgH
MIITKKRTLHYLLPALLLCSASFQAQSLHARASQRGTVRGLITTLSARGRGDILTIIVREQHRVRNLEKTDRQKRDSLAIQLESFNISPTAVTNGILPDLDIRTDKIQYGQAKQERDQTVEARVAVVVRDVLQNGVLVVSGKRTVRVDDEEKTLMISGLIYIQDITIDNTIDSDKVADAKISITGKGGNSQYLEKGPVARVIETAFWFVWPF